MIENDDPGFVFPTRVGMFRMRKIKENNIHSFPHARGDVPPALAIRQPVVLFSPRAWGCSAGGDLVQIQNTVFPTRVGMFRFFAASFIHSGRFPHARGDVPSWTETAGGIEEFSPRAWGCSEIRLIRYRATMVFPTRVGMFRMRQ